MQVISLRLLTNEFPWFFVLISASSLVIVWDTHQIFSSLPFYTKEDEHFLFNDIQVSKGKLRAPRKITTIVDGKEEEVNYRIAPCGGVEWCPLEGCSYCVPNWQHRPCPQQREASLVSSGECPVEFVYVCPTRNEDKRRWLSGIVRMKVSNLHSHPLHAPTKVPVEV